VFELGLAHAAMTQQKLIENARQRIGSACFDPLLTEGTCCRYVYLLLAQCRLLQAGYFTF